MKKSFSSAAVWFACLVASAILIVGCGPAPVEMKPGSAVKGSRIGMFNRMKAGAETGSTTGTAPAGGTATTTTGQ